MSKFMCCTIPCPVFTQRLIDLSNTRIRVLMLIRNARHGNNISSYPSDALLGVNFTVDKGRKMCSN